MSSIVLNEEYAIHFDRTPKKAKPSGKIEEILKRIRSMSEDECKYLLSQIEKRGIDILSLGDGT